MPCLSLWRIAILFATLYLLPLSTVQAESMHVFGIHFWDWGANVDVMSHRTGWVVQQASLSEGAMPDVGGHYEPAVAEGFTILQRLDWGDMGNIMPITEADQNTFAQRCGQWANALKHVCRTYTIANEVDFVEGMTPAIYASGFTKVRNAIRAVQPEAKVLVGHWTNGELVRQVVRTLGPDGYDGLTDHTPNSVPVGFLDMLDEENARPGVGVYITEWGWRADTNPQAMSVMRSFYLEIGASNASRARQVYCACWFLYPAFLDPGDEKLFSLQKATTYDNPAFEAATAIGTSFNSYSASPVMMTGLIADIPDSGTAIPVRWNTNVPARRQLWWTPVGTWGWQNERYTPFSTAEGTVHQLTMDTLSPATAYEVSPLSTKKDYADAGGRRFRVKSGPWSSQAEQSGPGRVTVAWATDWPTDSVVEYGPTAALGSTASSETLVLTHQLAISSLPVGQYFYRVLSSEANPDVNGARMYMRSPVRTFSIRHLVPGDLDEDCDVDQVDFGLFQACYSGPGVEQESPECTGARIDQDDDVDVDDFGLFLGCLSGPGICADPNCASQ
jgi:hypothetical protein